MACGCQLFAEVEPNQKERIILALRKRGHVVGFLGDGINDASEGVREGRRTFAKAGGWVGRRRRGTPPLRSRGSCCCL